MAKIKLAVFFNLISLLLAFSSEARVRAPKMQSTPKPPQLGELNIDLKDLNCLMDIPQKEIGNSSSQETVSENDRRIFDVMFLKNLASCVIPLTLYDNYDKQVNYDKSPVDFYTMGHWLREIQAIEETKEGLVSSLKKKFSYPNEAYGMLGVSQWSQAPDMRYMKPPGYIKGSENRALVESIKDIDAEANEAVSNIVIPNNALQIIYTGVFEFPNKTGVAPYLCLGEIENGLPKVASRPNGRPDYCKYKVALLIIQKVNWLENGYNAQQNRQAQVIEGYIKKIEITEADKTFWLGRIFEMDKIEGHMAGMHAKFGEMLEVMNKIADGVVSMESYVEKLQSHTSDMSLSVAQMAGLMGYMGSNLSRMSVNVGNIGQQFTPMGMFKNMFGG